MIEISRHISFGQYVDNGSHLTRLDPRAKILCFILVVAAVTYISHFIALAICLLFCLFLQWLSRLSLRYVLQGMRMFISFLLILFTFQVLFYTSSTQAASTIWHWGVLTVSWEGIIHSTQVDLRVIFLYYLTSLLMLTTSLVDLADGAEALLRPLRRFGLPVHELVMVFVVALKFVPLLITEVERLSIAQATRGVRFGRGNPWQRIRALSGIIVPLFMSGLQRVEMLSTAMEARCYRAGYRGWRRSKLRALQWSSSDSLALACSVLICALLIALNVVSPF
uniref:Energy-coupling factor transporter transmembrane protein EcfT n=1 Tax=Thermogemmatispora argillosa TaxID=2045280 RepID=A0A455T443_9CHLR|nr:energy-coupling factor transporter transmembrane protein EcfT [Thermogemmatispora argillosa]